MSVGVPPLPRDSPRVPEAATKPQEGVAIKPAIEDVQKACSSEATPAEAKHALSQAHTGHTGAYGEHLELLSQQEQLLKELQAVQSKLQENAARQQGAQEV